MEPVDFHSHCLPGMDDGAADTAEAVQMLRQSVQQGVYAVAATPHFYWGNETVEQFLERRQAAFCSLHEAIAATPALAGKIRLFLGAEVLMREHLSRQSLRPLCLEGTNCLMLELPFSSPPSWLYEEMETIVFDQKLRVILAHVDRYMAWYSREKMAELTELPDVIIQLNGDSLQHCGAIRALSHWLPETETVLFGSDMHHAKTRQQNLGSAMRHLMRCRSGRRWLAAAAVFSKQILDKPL